MNEIIKPNESFVNPESKNAVFKSTLLLNHESASDFITDKILNFPIKRIIVFGEPGANKTTIMLQLASELMEKSKEIEPNFIFYDDALAKAKKDLGANTLSKGQYPLVSNILTNQMSNNFPIDSSSDRRTIQFVELVGISLNDRGTSTLRRAAKRVSGQNMLEQDTLIIGVTADLRSLKYAGQMRKSITELDDHSKVFDVLEDYKTHVSDIPRDKPIEQVASEIVQFFGRMASEDRIKIVHNEVMTQANRRAIEDDYRLFRMLRVPELPFPIEDRETLKNYLLGAAFLQTYLSELGLKSEPYDLEPNLLRDLGIVIFSPYNPNITKVIDLSRALKSSI